MLESGHIHLKSQHFISNSGSNKLTLRMTELFITFLSIIRDNLWGRIERGLKMSIIFEIWPDWLRNTKFTCAWHVTCPRSLDKSFSSPNKSTSGPNKPNVRKTELVTSFPFIYYSYLIV